MTTRTASKMETKKKKKRKRLPFNIFKDSYANPYQKYFIKKEEYYESRNGAYTLAYIPTGNKFNKMLRDFYTLISNFSLFFYVSRYPYTSVTRYPIFFSYLPHYVCSTLIAFRYLSFVITYIQAYISVTRFSYYYFYFYYMPFYTQSSVVTRSRSALVGRSLARA